MESTLLLIGLAIAVIIAYKVGKRESEYIVEDLQIDNIRLVGKISRLNRDIDRLNSHIIKTLYDNREDCGD